MPDMKFNDDGTTSLVYSSDELSAAQSANAATEAARAKQLDADAERAKTLATARNIATPPALPDDAAQALAEGTDTE